MYSSNVKKLLDDFNKITKTEIVLTDEKFHVLLVSNAGFCKFCATIHSSGKCVNVCRQSDAEALSECEKTRGVYTYVCPFGLYNVCAPLYSGKRRTGYLMINGGRDARLEKDFPIKKALECDGELSETAVRETGKNMLCHTPGEMTAYVTFAELIAREISSTETEVKPTVGELVKQCVKNNISGKITLSFLSAQLHYSTVTLTEHFKREYGMSIMQYVALVRLRLAADMLASTDMTVSEVAEAAGFASAEYFSNCFKKFFGFSPSKRRESSNRTP